MQRVSDGWLERKRKEAEFLLEMGLLDDESEQATREALMVFTELAERREKADELEEELIALAACIPDIRQNDASHSEACLRAGRILDIPYREMLGERS